MMDLIFGDFHKVDIVHVQCPTWSDLLIAPYVHSMMGGYIFTGVCLLGGTP